MLKSLSLSAAVLAAAVLATPASATPVSGLKGIDAGTKSSLADQVNYRCWWRYGHRHCRYYGERYYYGPSIDLRFGGRHHRHYRHYHRY